MPRKDVRGCGSAIADAFEDQNCTNSVDAFAGTDHLRVHGDAKAVDVAEASAF